MKNPHKTPYKKIKKKKKKANSNLNHKKQSSNISRSPEEQECKFKRPIVNVL